MSDSQPGLLPVGDSEDPFESLEAKVRRAVEMVHSLRAENAQIAFQLERAQANRLDHSKLTAERDEARAEADQLRRDLAALKEQQREIRTRVQKALSQLDMLGS